MSTERKASTVAFKPAINITLSGLLAIFPRKKSCKVGLLINTHHPHKSNIQITQTDISGIIKDITPSAIKDPLELIVTPSQDISLRKFSMEIKRKKRPSAGHESEDSYAWVVDLESDEFYKKEIGARKAGFKPFLIFNSGELFTREISRNMLERQDPGKPFEDFGFVAVVVGVHIPLDQPNVQAVLKNGSDPKPIFEAEPNMSYGIVVDRGAVGRASGTVNDAESYYLDNAIGEKLMESEKIHFQSRVNRAAPEAACFVGFLGKSDPG